MSWQELAQSCILFLATHLLQLQSIQETKERADLLLHRLHARRSQGVRTTLPTQSAVELIHHVSSMMTEIAKMKSGELVSDIDASLARASVLKTRFLSLRQLAPGVKPRIEELTRVVKDAIESLLRRQVVQQGRRNLAQGAFFFELDGRGTTAGHKWTTRGANRLGFGLTGTEVPVALVRKILDSLFASPDNQKGRVVHKGKKY